MQHGEQRPTSGVSLHFSYSAAAHKPGENLLGRGMPARRGSINSRRVNRRLRRVQVAARVHSTVLGIVGIDREEFNIGAERMEGAIATPSLTSRRTCSSSTSRSCWEAEGSSSSHRVIHPGPKLSFRSNRLQTSKSWTFQAAR